MAEQTLDFKEQFEVPSKMKTWSYALIGIGLLAFIIGLFTKGTGTNEEKAIFMGTIMYNTIFWTMVCNAAMFFICATTLAMGGWQMTFRRVAEAISTLVPVFGIITLVVLFYIVFTGNHEIYHWLDAKQVAADEILKGKSGFLNVKFFVIWSILTVGLWSLLGWRMRKISSEADIEPMDYNTGNTYVWKNTVTAGLFIVWFALTVGSTLPTM